MSDEFQKTIMCIGGPLHLQVQKWDGRAYNELVVAEPMRIDVRLPSYVKYKRVRSVAERLLSIPWQPFKATETICVDIPFCDPPKNHKRYKAMLFSESDRRLYFFVFQGMKDCEAIELIQDSRKAMEFFLMASRRFDSY